MITGSSKGFTIVELLVVVAIIGILSAIGVVSYNGYVSGSKKTAAENTIQQIALAQSEEYANSGSYSVTGDPPTDACSANNLTSLEIESELFGSDNIIPDDIDFEMCIYGSGSTFTIQAEHQQSECTITLVRNGATTRTDC